MNKMNNEIMKKKKKTIKNNIKVKEYQESEKGKRRKGRLLKRMELEIKSKIGEK